MILLKEQYYKRRWFLTILFLLSGFWLIYMAYGTLEYNKDKNELKKGTNVPSRIIVNKSTRSKNEFLILFFGNKKIASVIEEEELDKMIFVTKKNELAIINSPLYRSNLNEISFEYIYWKDRLYELKVNDTIIIEYKKGSKTMAYVILTIGILWTSFQIWVIVTLAIKGIRVYDESFKK